MLRIKKDGSVVDITPPKKQQPKKPKIPPMYGAKTRRKIPWSEEELEYLQRWWYEMDPWRIAFNIYRTEEDVRRVAKKLGLRDPEKMWDDVSLRMRKVVEDLNNE